MFEYRQFGPLEVRRNGAVVAVGPRKPREVLAALILANGDAVSIDRLQTVLWDDDPPKTARGSIHVYISQLRAQLDTEDESIIESLDAGYRLRIDPGSVDIVRFDDAVRDGLDSLRIDRPEAAVQALDEALAIAAGDPLADFAYRDFAQPRIAYLAQRRRAALEGRLEARLAAGEHRQVASEAQMLLHDDPYNEALWETLMLALYRSQRRTEALRTFRIVSARLAEAGLEPSARLVDLEDRILRQDPTLLPAGGHQPPSNLPSGIGTADATEVGIVTRDLLSNAVVTLVGEPRTTRAVALEAARHSAEQYPDGLWHADLAGRSGEDAVARTVLDAIGVISGADPRRTLAEYLTTRQSAVVITGVDQATEELAWLAGQLDPADNGSRIIATLATAPAETIGLTRRARAVSPANSLDPAGGEGRLLSRMACFAGPATTPAIRHVAGFPPLDGPGIDYLLGRLAASGRLTVDNALTITRYRLTGVPEALPEDEANEAHRRHREYCLALSDQIIGAHLGPGRLDVVRLAALEHEELEHAIANAVADDRLDVALRIGNAAGRYWSIHGTNFGRVVSVLAPLVDHDVATADSASVALSVGFAHFRLGAYADAGRLLDVAVRRAEQAGDPTTATRALVERAHLQMFRGDHDTARADLDAAGRLAEQLGSPALEARVQMLTAQVGMRGAGTAGRSEQRDLLEAAALTFERLGHTTRLANALLVLASWYIDVDDPPKAVSSAQRALAMTQLGDDRSMFAFALARLAEAYLADGEPESAERNAKEAIKVAESIGNHLVATLAYLAAASATDDKKEAVDLARKFVSLRNDLGVPVTPREQDTLDGLAA